MKEIKGYEGFYSASKDGNIYRVGTMKKGVLTHLESPKPLKKVVTNNVVVNTLHKDCKGKSHQVGRVIWETYNNDLRPQDVIKMKDGDILNTRLDNLYKVSKSKVIKDSIDKGNFKQHITNLKKWGKLKDNENE